jgi:chemotaxis protein MotB
MNVRTTVALGLMLVVGFSSCVTKKQFQTVQTDLSRTQRDLRVANDNLAACQGDLKAANASLNLRKEQYDDLRDQLSDAKNQRDKQVTQVGNLTTLSKSANANIAKTLQQLEQKDRYIQMVQAARTKADSINLALAINLKKVLRDGIEDQDIEIKVDKTVVMINLSDKMLYKSGSADLTPRANDVLEKIAAIIQSRPNYEVMVEGYTDNVPISNERMQDNWDLSVIRATSVVRSLQNNYNVDPNRLIAAGRGEYNTLASNDTEIGRMTNRRTRIIILPKLDQFYDLLDPEKAVKQ